MAPRGKVYVIDDDEAMRDSLDFLLGAADFDVTLFESAQHFLDALPGVDFGCVVSDVRMPGIDGIELLKRLKADGRPFPVLIMTGWEYDISPRTIEVYRANVMTKMQASSLSEPVRLAMRAGAINNDPRWLRRPQLQ